MNFQSGNSSFSAFSPTLWGFYCVHCIFIQAYILYGVYIQLIQCIFLFVNTLIYTQCQKWALPIFQSGLIFRIAGVFIAITAVTITTTITIFTAITIITAVKITTTIIIIFIQSGSNSSPPLQGFFYFCDQKCPFSSFFAITAC